MNKKFKKLKTKNLLGAILKNAICGLSAGLFVAGALVIAFKLAAISFDLLWYVLIGVGVALIVCAIAFIFFRPTDKKVAEKLDNEFGLEERVQTSLAYKDKAGTIVEMQREDAAEKLNSLPKSKVKFSGIWQFCLIAVVAIAIVVTSFFIPARQAQGAGSTVEPGEQDKVVTEIQVEALRGVINNVNGSELDVGVKRDVVAELQTLLDTATAIYKEEIKVSENVFNGMVISTIYKVEPIINDTLDYTIISDVIRANGEANMARAVLNGGKSYSTFDIKDYGHVTAFSETEPGSTNSRLGGGVDAFRASLDKTLEEGFVEIFNTVATNFVSVMNIDNFAESGITANNTLYACINKFAQELLRTSNTLEVPDTEDEKVIKDFQDGIKQSLDNLFADFKNQLSTELMPQSYAGAMRRYVRNRLCAIFGLADETEVPEDVEGEYGGSGGGKDDDSNGQHGGGGTGGLLVGSNDMIYDPLVGDYVEYVTIVARYNAILDELRQSGALTEEQLAMAKAYFDFLLGIEEAE